MWQPGGSDVERFESIGEEGGERFRTGREVLEIRIRKRLESMPIVRAAQFNEILRRPDTTYRRKQQRVDHTEQGCARADAHGEREHGRHREARSRSEVAHAMADIADQSVEHGLSPIADYW